MKKIWNSSISFFKNITQNQNIDEISTEHNNNKIRKFAFPQAFFILLFPLTILITHFAKLSPEWIEQYYSQSVFPIMSQSIGSIVGLFPLSLIEFLIYIAALLLVGFIVHFIYNFIVSKTNRLFYIINLAVNICVVISLFVFLFTLLCGLNYHRMPTKDILNLDCDSITTDDLISVTQKVADKTNALSYSVSRTQDGFATLSSDELENIGSIANAAFEANYIDYPILNGVYGKPKPVLASEAMSVLNITGFFSPFTFEANYNNHSPQVDIPYTLCHELAHLRGFMREDEAGFWSYLVLRDYSNDFFSYSGNLNTLAFLLGDLKNIDLDAYSKIVENLDPNVKLDFQCTADYWSNYSGFFGDFFQSQNDLFLKLNSQDLGVESYDQVVQLVVAYELSLKI